MAIGFFSVFKTCRLCQRTFFRTFSSSRKLQNYKICIVGSGPGGFYTAMPILKNTTAEVDILDKLPAPFGLVRYGVAPDHPEIKNVIDSFHNVATKDQCNFYGNIEVGKDISIAELQKAYHAVILAYGSSNDYMLNIPGENLPNVISARNFVGWYNGLPANADLKVNLDIETAVVIGQGNVALDVARILLTSVERLKNTDITDHALSALKQSRLKRVILIGRRGPLQIACTIKELRELTKLPGCRPVFDKNDFKPLKEIVSTLKRPKKRLTELMISTSFNEVDDEIKKSWNEATREFELRFCRTPKAVIPTKNMEGVQGLTLGINRLEEIDGKVNCIMTEDEENIDCGLILRSIGYKSVPLDPDVPFDHKLGIVSNINGRVLNKKGLYCAGWVKTGPLGVIAYTMNSSFETGKTVLEDLHNNVWPSDDRPGIQHVKKCLEEKGVNFVSYDDWMEIDKYEIAEGEKVGKVREKVLDFNSVLKLLGRTR